jgi:hypothetical protein
LIDLSRLQREVEAIEIFMAQAKARAGGDKALVMPRTTRNMEVLCHDNGLNLLVEADRTFLKNFLKTIHDKAPRIHISFAADPSAAFIQKIVGWFRGDVHPQTILQVGLQPTIAAGCVVRTTNKYFDLSLRKDFDKHRQLLIDTMREVRAKANKPPASSPKPPGPTSATAGLGVSLNIPARPAALATPAADAPVAEEVQDVR